MKKLLTGLLATVTCFSCFTAAACKEDEKDKTNLQAAGEYLVGLYGESNKKGREDYEVINTFAVDDVTYTITWTVTLAEGATEGATVVEGSEGKSKIDLVESLAADVAYTLTATITAPNGTTHTVTFDRVVEAAPNVMPLSIAAAPVPGTTYKLYMQQAVSKKDEYFSGAMKGYFLASTTEYTEAVDITVEAVADKTNAFYLTFCEPNKTTKQYIGVKNVWSTDGGASYHDNIFYAESTALEAGVAGTFEWNFNDDYDIMTATVEGVKSGEVQEVEGTTETFYMGTTGTYYTFDVNYLKDIGTENPSVGKLVQMVERESVTDAQKVNAEKINTAIYTTKIHSGARTVELPTKGDTFDTVAISWALKEGATTATLEGSTLTLAAAEADATFTLVATLTLGETTESVEITATHESALTAEQIVDLAYALESGKSMTSAQTLTGTIVKVTNAYNEEFSNISVTIMVNGKEDKPIGSFRLKGVEGLDIRNLKEGDTITVSGILKNDSTYGVQFPEGSTIDSIDSTTAGTVEKARVEAYNLSIKDITKAGAIELPDVGVKCTDLAISWASNKDFAVISGNTLTVAELPEEKTDLTLTATISLEGAPVLTYAYTVSVASRYQVTYVFSSYTAGDQYAEETHTLDSMLTMDIVECHLTNELRIYSSSTHNGNVKFTSTNVIKEITFNAGNKKDTLNVYGSTDGTNWTLIEGVVLTSTSYLDYTVTIENSTYKYIKLDVEGSQQVRIKSMAIVYAAN